MRARPLVLAALLAILALVVAGCGGGDDGDGDGGRARSPSDDVRLDGRPHDDRRGRARRGQRRRASTRPGSTSATRPASSRSSACCPGESGLSGTARQGLGSGFVLNGDGEVATNAHVVTEGEGRAIAKAKEVYVAFADGNQVPARIVGYDANADIALLKIDPAGLTLRPLRLGTARDLRVGSPVAAIGSPFGEPQSLSVGVVSATDRSIKSLTGFEIAGAIQTDAAINRGNSGGPLVNAKGDVLGVNSQIQSTSGGGEGVGYAVPADTVRRTLDRAARGRQGRVRLPRRRDGADLPAARAPFPAAREHRRVGPGGRGGRSGRRGGAARRHATSAASRRGRSSSAATSSPPSTARSSRTRPRSASRCWTSSPGETVTLRVYRDGKPRDVRVRLGSRPQQTGDRRAPMSDARLDRPGAARARLQPRAGDVRRRRLVHARRAAAS